MIITTTITEAIMFVMKTYLLIANLLIYITSSNSS